MDIKNKYEKLYQYWLNEFKQSNITTLTNELFNIFKKCLEYIDDYNLNHEASKDDNVIISKIISSYKNNFKFLFDDLLEMREIKIINSALALEEIKLENLLEAEKLFYQNLVSDIKGFKKVMAMSISEDVQSVNINNIEESESEIKEELIQNEALEAPQVAPIVESNIHIKANEDDFNYILIKILKNTPPLVGIDLINYGPFKKEDIANIPFKNAIILINEKFAEKIE